MFLADYCSEDAAGWVSVAPEQASHFAKNVAGDFNPIHDAAARRFCVPGDLLFALALSRFGLSQRMTFRFSAMVGRQTPFRFEMRGTNKLVVKDRADKIYLEAERDGDCTMDAAVIEAFARRYVAFSGLNFPHYLKPLLEKHQVMFNPERPLVIYDSMGFSLSNFDMANADLAFTGADLRVEGKRAEVLLEFEMGKAEVKVGSGSKKLIISGLRPYDPAAIDDMIDRFYKLKAAYERDATP